MLDSGDTVIQGLPQASEVEGERGTPNTLEPGSCRGGNHGIGIPDWVLALFCVRPLIVNTREPPFSLLQYVIMSDRYFPWPTYLMYSFFHTHVLLFTFTCLALPWTQKVWCTPEYICCCCGSCALPPSLSAWVCVLKVPSPSFVPVPSATSLFLPLASHFGSHAMLHFSLVHSTGDYCLPDLLLE